MANRFTRVTPQQYVSLYTPYNEQLIYNLGKEKDNQFNKDLQDIEDQKALFKVNAASTDLQDRDSLIKNYTSNFDKLADEYFTSGNRDLIPKFRKIASDFNTDETRSILENNYNTEKKIKEARQNLKENYRPIGGEGYDPWLAYEQERKSGGKLKKQDFSGNMFGFEDYKKPGQELVADIAKDQTAFSNIRKNDNDAVYELADGTRKFIDRTKVRNVAVKNAEAFLGTNGGRWFIDEHINQIAPGTGHRNLSELPPEIQKEVYDKAVNYLEDLGYKQIFEENKINKDIKNQSEFSQKGLQEKKDLFKLRGSSIEGTTTNMLGEDAKSLINDGIIKEDGTIDWSSLKDVTVEGAPKYYGQGMTPSQDPNSYKNIKVTDQNTKRNKLNNTIKKMATALGKDFNTLKAANGDYEKIVKDYNEFAKTRAFDVALMPQVAMRISDNINNQGGLTNYTIQSNNKGEFYDLNKLNDETSDLLNSGVNKIEIVNRRDKDGKMILEGVVKDRKTDEIKGSVNLRPKMKEEINYFDQVSNIQQKAIEYMTTGELKFKNKENDNKEVRLAIGNNTMVQLAQYAPERYQVAYSLLDTDNPVLVDQMQLPTGESVSILANPSVPGKQVYINNDNGSIYPSIADLKVDMDMQFYNTSSGAIYKPETKNKTELK